MRNFKKKKHRKAEYPYLNRNSKIWRPRVWFVTRAFVGIVIIRYLCSFIPEKSADQFWNVFILGSVTYMMLLTAWVQIDVNRRQWRVMKKQGRIMRDQLEMMASLEAAYIGFDEWNLSKIGSDNMLTINGVIFNGGRSPSWNLRTKFQITRGEGIWPNHFIGVWDENIFSSPRMLIAGERSPFTVGSIKVDQKILDNLYAGTSTLIFDGQCTYLDVMGNTRIYEMGYVFQFKEGDHRVIERYKQVTTRKKEKNDEQNPN